MTNYNERLDEILKNLRNEAYEQAGLADATVKEAKQALTSLINQQVVQALEKIKGALPDTNDDSQFSPDGAGGWDLESYKLGIDDAVDEIDNLIKEYKGDKG